jgi:hypothetical protein
LGKIDMPSRYDGYDGVMTTVLMAAVGVVFGFLGGVVAGAEAVAVPIAAITFLVTGTVFLLSRPVPLPQIITYAGQTRIMRGFR